MQHPNQLDCQCKQRKALLTSQGQYKGLVFAEVIPRWAFSQKVKMKRGTKSALKEFKQELENSSLRLPRETYPEFIKRRGLAVQNELW